MPDVFSSSAGLVGGCGGIRPDVLSVLTSSYAYPSHACFCGVWTDEYAGIHIKRSGHSGHHTNQPPATTTRERGAQ